MKSKIWKHHTAEHFENGTLTQNNALAAAGSTVFVDYDAMIEYLKRTRQRWYIAELEVDEAEIRHYKNGYMATILVDKPTTSDFKYIKTNE